MRQAHCNAARDCACDDAEAARTADDDVCIACLRGIGTEAVRSVVRRLIDERGHHRITIDPAAENAAAIRASEKVGFRPVGVMRAYERDVSGEGWHDGLLMELLAGEEPLG